MESTQKCPYCGEEILATAKKCRYCGEWLPEKTGIQETRKTTAVPEASSNPSSATAAKAAAASAAPEEEVKDGFFQYYWGEVCRKHLFDFQGKLGRKDYWCAVVALFVMQSALFVISLMTTMTNDTFKMLMGVGASILYLLLFITSMALAVRRLHDTGRSGWWLWLNLLPLIGQIALLIMLCQPGETPSPRVKSNIGDWISLALFLFAACIWMVLLS